MKDFNFDIARLVANILGGEDIPDSRIRELMEQAKWCSEHDRIIITLYHKFLSESGQQHDALLFGAFCTALYERRDEVIFQETEDGSGFVVIPMSKN